MSDEKEVNVRVLNQEYERVLSNPENVIVSEDLQALLDLPLDENNEVAPLIDTMVISVLDTEGLPISVRGEFNSLSKSGEEYSATVSCERVKKEFLSSLESLTQGPGLLTFGGNYDLEISDCDLRSWSITQVGGPQFSLNIQFRSKNGIF